MSEIDENELVPEPYLSDYQLSRIKIREGYVKEILKARGELSLAIDSLIKKYSHELSPAKSKVSRVKTKYKKQLNKLDTEWLENNPGKDLPELKIW